METTKRNAVTVAILARIAAGSTPLAALDEVLGAGVSARLAADLYDALRARAAAPR